MFFLILKALLIVILCCVIAITLHNVYCLYIYGSIGIIGSNINERGVFTGGNTFDLDYLDNLNNLNRMLIPDKAVLVVDGHNMIHDLAHYQLTEDTFDLYLRNISKMMLEAFPTQRIHIVIKNQQNTTGVKKLVKKDIKSIPVYHKLLNVSKIFPDVSFHLAYDNTSITSKHIDKARDDFLTIKLAKNSYMISRDRFRDFKHFKNIKPFYHYAITNGKVVYVDYVDPQHEYDLLDPPTRGNHYIYELVDAETLKKNNIQNGSIFLTDESVFGKIYIKKI